MANKSIFSKTKRVFIGKRLSNEEASKQELSKGLGLAMLSPDAISSIAYGPEQVFLALMIAGVTAFWWAVPLGIAVVVLLGALVLSYKQIIKAYPEGGGGYVVTSRNLGKNAGLVAGGSLLLDYMLTVAVSVSAGADAIMSALPSLAHHQVFISLLLIIGITIMNLRGVGESATILLVPVYMFVGIIIITFGIGFIQLASGFTEFTPTAPIGTSVSGLTLFIILRAFSIGSSSLTGVEAISNAVPMFKKPKARNASSTLSYMGIILGVFFFSVIFLSYAFGLVPDPDVTLLAQIGQKVFGEQNFLFYFLQISTALILAVAASTGFSGFPSVSYNMAKDKFMPHAFQNRGARLSFSNGIITLAIGASLLIVLFHGDTTHLIPLYAIGVFIPFTLSQVAMVVKWYNERYNAITWVWYALPNIIGSIITFTVVIILFITHFFLPIISLVYPSQDTDMSEFDVWPFFIIMPILIFIFIQINKHYEQVSNQLSRKLRLKKNYSGNLVVLLVGNITSIDEEAIKYAEVIGDEIIALRVSTGENEAKDNEIIHEFRQLFPDIKLTIIKSNDRTLTPHIVDFVQKTSREQIKRNYSTTVLIPEFQPQKQWQNILHNQTALRIKLALGYTDNVIISSFIYQLKG